MHRHITIGLGMVARTDLGAAPPGIKGVVAPFDLVTALRPLLRNDARCQMVQADALGTRGRIPLF